MQIRFQNKLLYLLFSMVLLLTPACVEKRDLSQNVVIAHYTTEPQTLHPVNGSSASMYYIFDYTQKTLTRIDLRTKQQIPILVRSLPSVSEDGLSYTFVLRDDVKWDNGSPLTVEDVIFTVKASKLPLSDNAARRSSFFNIKNIIRDPDNPLAFTMTAKEVYYKNPYMFDEMFIVQKKHFDPKGVLEQVPIEAMDEETFDPEKYPGLTAWATAFNSSDNGRVPENLNGLGPYKVSEWVPGSSVKLVRKENWWGDNDTTIYSKAYPEKIIFTYSTDDATTYLALKKENIDVTTFISTNYLLKLADKEYFNDNYVYGYNDMYSYNYIAMNTRPDAGRTPFFNDKKVRRAMAYLVPVEEIIQTMALGKGTRLASFVQPIYDEYYNDTLPLIPYDPLQARKLLSEAGWADSDGNGIRDKLINGKKVQFSFYYSYPASPSNKEIALMIKDAMYKAGIDLVPLPMDIGTLVGNVTSHNFDMMTLAWSGGSIPEDPEQIFHTSNWANQGYNFVGFGNAKTDSLIEESNKTLDKDKRIYLLKKLQAIVYEEQPYIFTYSVKRKTVIHKRFANSEMYDERPGVALNNLKLTFGAASSGSHPDMPNE